MEMGSLRRKSSHNGIERVLCVPSRGPQRREGGSRQHTSGIRGTSESVTLARERAELRQRAEREGHCFQARLGDQVAIDQYAEKALGKLRVLTLGVLLDRRKGALTDVGTCVAMALVLRFVAR
jgi:hypothetical protein